MNVWICCGVAVGPSIAWAGPPGSMCMMMNVTSETPITTRSAWNTRLMM
jgi:hypothetical protein